MTLQALLEGVAAIAMVCGVGWVVKGFVIGVGVLAGVMGGPFGGMEFAVGYCLESQLTVIVAALLCL